MKRSSIALLCVFIGLLGIGFITLSQDDNSDAYTLPAGSLDSNEVVGDVSPATFDENANRLIIEKIGVDAAILEGDETMLEQGVWHLPRTGTPEEIGNTVLSSHRWKFPADDPRSFYDLDELALGDSVVVWWEGEQYIYEVYDIYEVTPDQVGILAPSDEPELTLFTCTPLYSTDKRLVIKGRLQKDN